MRISNRPAVRFHCMPLCGFLDRNISEFSRIDLLGKNEKSGLNTVFFQICEHLIAGLSGSQLARWRSKGVSHAVLNALQVRFPTQLSKVAGQAVATGRCRIACPVSVSRRQTAGLHVFSSLA